MQVDGNLGAQVSGCFHGSYSFPDLQAKHTVSNSEKLFTESNKEVSGNRSTSNKSSHHHFRPEALLPVLFLFHGSLSIRILQIGIIQTEVLHAAVAQIRTAEDAALHDCPGQVAMGKIQRPF